MPRLVWDEEQPYGVGLARGVFYPQDGPGEVWNGLVEVEEIEEENNQTQYFDGRKIHKSRSSGEFSGIIKSYAYPSSFVDTILGVRKDVQFGFSYQIMTENSYKIHLVYNALLSPFQQTHSYNDGANQFSLEFTTKPVEIPSARRSSHLVVDVGTAKNAAVFELEDLLYGTESLSASLPSPDVIYAIFEKNADLTVIDNGDGSFTVTGPESLIRMIDSSTFEINVPTAQFVDDATYTLDSF